MLLIFDEHHVKLHVQDVRNVFYVNMPVQVDVFALAMIMQEVFSGIITSAIVVGPTLDPRAADVYAYKVSSHEQLDAHIDDLTDLI